MLCDLTELGDRAEAAVKELLSLEKPHFYPPRLLVVGCSTSEIAGGTIGHASAPEIGLCVAEAVLRAARPFSCACAFQCCEHLNRALVVERETAEKYGLEELVVVPRPKAGGSLGSGAWKLLRDPVCVESLRADCGLDIGGTLIGMHLRPVAVPVRLSVSHVGEAALLAARCRPRLIGGERARYTEED